MTRGRISAVSSILVPDTRPVTIRTQLQKRALQAKPGSVKVVAGDPGTGQATLILPASDPVPKTGQTLVEDVSASAPGIIAVVKHVTAERGGGTQLETEPGTLADAYSSFNVDLNGTLASLSSAFAIPAEQGSRADDESGTLDGGWPKPKFSCPDHTFQPTITSNIDLSDLKVGVDVDLSSAPFASISLSGQPIKLDLQATFTGSATCTAEAEVSLGIKHTPLSVTLGPDFQIVASGAVTATWHWHPYFDFNAWGGPTVGFSTSHGYSSSGGLKVKGSADVTADFDLLDEVGGDNVDIKALIGPEVSADASYNDSQACATARDFEKARVSGDFLGTEHDFGTLAWGFHTLLPWSCTGTPVPSPVPPAPPSPPTPAPGPLTSPGQVSLAAYHACAVLGSGSVACWGNDQGGALGNGTSSGFSDVPLTVPGVQEASAVAVGDVRGANESYLGGFSCALLTSGGVDCWGDNAGGALGDGTTTSHSLPAPVSGLNDATAISASETDDGGSNVGGTGHVCALLVSQTVDCWGENDVGQLGNGTTTDATTPVPVSNLSNVTTVSAGDNASCALVADGTVSCWGQFVDRTVVDSTTPVSISGVSDAVGLSGNGAYWCALLASGHPACWGSADDDFPCSPQTFGFPPSFCGGGSGGGLISSFTGAVAIAASSDHACAIMADRTAQCWGYNSDGQLGDGDASGYGPPAYDQPLDTPVTVAGGKTWSALAAGTDFSCGVATSGGLWCWGNDQTGQLGNGAATVPSPVPVEVFPPSS